MQEQFRWSVGQADHFHPLFYERFVLANYADRPDMVLMTHALALYRYSIGICIEALYSNPDIGLTRAGCAFGR
jgi:hypothetical protein